jgi:hypothetical protein
VWSNLKAASVHKQPPLQGADREQLLRDWASIREYALRRIYGEHVRNATHTGVRGAVGCSKPGGGGRGDKWIGKQRQLRTPSPDQTEELWSQFVNWIERETVVELPWLRTLVRA